MSASQSRSATISGCFSPGLGASRCSSSCVRVEVQHVLGRGARLAAHRRPHLELRDRLVQGHRHDERLRVLEHQFADRDGEQRAVDVPQDGPDAGQRGEVRPGLDRVRLRRGRPGEVAAVEPGGVLFQREGHRPSGGFASSSSVTPRPRGRQGRRHLSRRAALTLRLPSTRATRPVDDSNRPTCPVTANRPPPRGCRRWCRRPAGSSPSYSWCRA